MKISEQSPLTDPLSGLRQFLTLESPLKMMKNAFYFMLKALFVLFDIYIFIMNFRLCRKMA